ncbi:hypothetical protein PLICRDRAFT_696279 [Plicaturopsis crispa FD-325 SS-3]|nr:hypothetical protein PLICRDRAFT_696279 [Plicaturopsis crispa FD-325 SS-3]
MSTYRKSVLITGCSAGGIGASLAKEFHRRGLLVIATSRRLSKMQELAALGIEIRELDVTDLESIRKVRDEVSTMTGGKLDILVNNAGQGYTEATSAVDNDLSQIRNLFEVNVFGAMMMAKEYTQLIIAAGGGVVLQVGSISSVLPIPFGSAYSASKAAMNAFGNVLRIELAPFNIKVTTVLTGAVRTNIATPAIIPARSFYSPMADIFAARDVNVHLHQKGTPADEYARIVVAEALSSSPRAWMWVGHLAWIAWLLTRILPAWCADYMLSDMFGLFEFKKMIRSGGTAKTPSVGDGDVKLS